MIAMSKTRIALALVICFTMIFGGMSGTALADNHDQPVDEIVCDGDEPAEGAGILAFIISLLVYAAIVGAILAALVSLVTGFIGGSVGGVGTIVGNMKSVVGVVIIIYLIVLFAEPLFGFNIGCLFPFV